MVNYDLYHCSSKLESRIIICNDRDGIETSYQVQKENEICSMNRVCKFAILNQYFSIDDRLYGVRHASHYNNERE